VTTIPKAFARYPREAAIIGQLVSGYGELEFDLAYAVRWIIDDEDTAFKVMFRGPGEMQRILMADALARGKIADTKQKTIFEQTLASMHVCRKIRNQYAHCHWMDSVGGGLKFIQLEEIAEQHAPVVISTIKQYGADASLLSQQQAYFLHTQRRWHYLALEFQARRGVIASNPIAVAPRTMRTPKMHN